MRDFIGAELLLLLVYLGVRLAGLLGVQHGKEIDLFGAGGGPEFSGCGLIKFVAVLLIASAVEGLQPLSGLSDVGIHVTAFFH